jgi:hypothetical protein
VTEPKKPEKKPVPPTEEELYHKVTDMIKVSADSGIVVLSSFPVHFGSVFCHEDRLICDEYVYSSHNFALLQTLDHDMINGCVLTAKLICCGHGSGGKLSLWSWTGTCYDLIRKTVISSGPNVLNPNPNASGG